MHISTLDPSDTDAWDEWHSTYLASDTHGRPYAEPWMSNELRQSLMNPSSGEVATAFAGVEEGRVVATGWVELTLKDNLDVAFADLHVHPDRRGHGLGSRMLRHLEAFVADSGRTRLLVEVNHPFETDPEATGHPGAEFLRAHGYTFAIGDIRRVLDLPLDTELLPRLRAEADPFHADYTFRSFVGPCPDDIAEQFGQLVGRVVTEAPQGELDLEAEVFDLERLREDEQLFEVVGRRKYSTVAVDVRGDLVAFTDLVVPAEDPGKAYQWGTLVVPEHRGHRLGMAVKVRNLELMLARESGLELVSTCNAEVNDVMVAINERLGFRPVERLAEFQKRL